MAIWLFDRSRNLWFWYDHIHDQLVFQDNRRVPRPPNIPRSHYFELARAQEAHAQAAAQGQAVVQQQASSSPPSHPQYIHGPQSVPPQHVGGTSAAAPSFPASHPQYPYGQPNALSPQPGGLASAMRNLQLDPPHSPPGSPPNQARQVPPVAGRVYNSRGVRMVSAVHPQTQVQTFIGTGPAERITDPALLQHGVRAHRALYGTRGDEETLYSTFKLRDRKFFQVGRVFLVLWTEPAGETATLITSTERSDRLPDPGLTPGRYGSTVYSKVRRFVVVRPTEQFSSALPIVSYGKQGVGKQGVRKKEHAIIYTGETPPKPTEDELPRPGEESMRPRAIRVVPDNPADTLDPMSRLDFGKLHTVHHNLKVRPFGFVHPHSMEPLMSSFRNVWRMETATAAEEDDDDDEEEEEEGEEEAVADENRAPRAGDAAGNDDRNASPGIIRAQAADATAQQAQNTRARVAALQQQGLTRREAIEHLTRQAIEARPALRRESVIALIRARLAYGQPPRLHVDGGETGDDDNDDDDDDDDEDESDAHDDGNDDDEEEDEGEDHAEDKH